VYGPVRTVPWADGGLWSPLTRYWVKLRLHRFVSLTQIDKLTERQNILTNFVQYCPRRKTAEGLNVELRVPCRLLPSHIY